MTFRYELENEEHALSWPQALPTSDHCSSRRLKHSNTCFQEEIHFSKPRIKTSWREFPFQDSHGHHFFSWEASPCSAAKRSRFHRGCHEHFRTQALSTYNRGVRIGEIKSLGTCQTQVFHENCNSKCSQNICTCTFSANSDLWTFFNEFNKRYMFQSWTKPSHNIHYYFKYCWRQSASLRLEGLTYQK